MNQAVQFLRDSTKGIRGTSITASFVDTFRVPYHGNDVPLKHVAYTSPTKGQIMVKLYDPSMVGTVQKALNAGGLTAYTFSKDMVAVSVPAPSGEDKKQIIQRLNKLAEDARISVRSIRKQYRSKLPDTERPKFEAAIQAATDKAVAEIDHLISLIIDDL